MNKTEIFQVLGIEETKDESLIKRAYREKRRKIAWFYLQEEWAYDRMRTVLQVSDLLVGYDGRGICQNQKIRNKNCYISHSI